MGGPKGEMHKLRPRVGAGPLKVQQETHSLDSKLWACGAPALPSDWPRPSEGQGRRQEEALKSPLSLFGPLRSSHRGMEEWVGLLSCHILLLPLLCPYQQNSPAHHPSEKLIMETQDISTDKNLQAHVVPPGFREKEVTTQRGGPNLPIGIAKLKTSHIYK